MGPLVPFAVNAASAWSRDLDDPGRYSGRDDHHDWCFGWLAQWGLIGFRF